MALTEVDSGTADVVLDTPETLATVTADGSFVLVVDLHEMVNGDVVILTIQTKVLTGSTSRVAYRAIYAHAQGAPNVYSVPVPSLYELIATLEQTDGTARDYDWAVLQLDG